MPQISIPFTFDPISNKVFITLPYDVTNTGLGSETLTIPYTVNSVKGEPDIFIPINIGGKTISMPIDLEDPEINLNTGLNILGLTGVPVVRVPYPYYNGSVSGTGEITVWWENYEYPTEPPVIDDPIFIDDQFWVEDPLVNEPPIISDPLYPSDEQPYLVLPKLVDPIPSLPEISDPYISIPITPYNPEISNPYPNIPEISTPFPNIPEVSNPYPYVSVAIEEENVLPEGNPPILVVDSSAEPNKPKILLPLDRPIPFVVDENSAEPRILIDYTNVDGNIVVGTEIPTVPQPNANLNAQELQAVRSASGTNTGTTNLADQINTAINNIIPNINPPNIPENPLSFLGVGFGNNESVASTPYSFSALSYPDNLGDTSFTGHYINFYINATSSSKYLQGGSYSYSDPDGTYGYSSTSQASVGGNLPGGSDNPDALPNVQSVSHQRITQAISLYIPDSMNFSQTIQWENANLLEAGKSLGQGVAGIAGAIRGKAEQQKGGKLTNALKSLSGFLPAAEIVGQAYGYAINPQLLVLFRAIGFRTFQYDFYFTPKNATEAQSVRKIIRAFRFHSHPELSAGYGVFYITPSTFDIEFIHKGAENKNIHKVKTCALLKYDVDYAPAGWATYTDGMPVQTRLSLQFQETQIVTKEDIEKGY